MKKLLILAFLLCLAGCGEDSGPWYSHRRASAATGGTSGHYSCIVYGYGTDPIYVGDYRSATDADAYCIQVDKLLKSATVVTTADRPPLKAATTDGMNEAAAAGAIAVSR